MVGLTLPGWNCPSPACRIFNGEAKSMLYACRNCGTPRPTPKPVPRHPDVMKRRTALMLADQGHPMTEIGKRIGVSKSRAHEFVKEGRERRAALQELGVTEPIAEERAEENTETLNSDLLKLASDLAQAKAEIRVLQEENRRLQAQVNAVTPAPSSTGGQTTFLTKHVRAFHERFGHPLGKTPAVPEATVLRFRLALSIEEFGEMMLACTTGEDAAHWRKDVHHALTFLRVVGSTIQPAWVNLPELVDALGDLDYVTEGFRVVLGVNGSPIANAIHTANMTKEPVLKTSFTATEWNLLLPSEKRCLACGCPKRSHVDERAVYGSEEKGFACPRPGALPLPVFTAPDRSKKPTKPVGWAPPDIGALLIAQGWKP